MLDFGKTKTTFYRCVADDGRHSNTFHSNSRSLRNNVVVCLDRWNKQKHSDTYCSSLILNSYLRERVSQMYAFLMSQT